MEANLQSGAEAVETAASSGAIEGREQRIKRPSLHTAACCYAPVATAAAALQLLDTHGCSAQHIRP